MNEKLEAKLLNYALGVILLIGLILNALIWLPEPEVVYSMDQSLSPASEVYFREFFKFNETHERLLCGAMLENMVKYGNNVSSGRIELCLDLFPELGEKTYIDCCVPKGNWIIN